MRKFALLALILVLTICLLAGCRRGNNAETMIDDASEAIDDMIPEGSDGAATDGDGIIDDGSGARNGSGFSPVHH